MENSIQTTSQQLALKSAVNPFTKKLWENLLLLGTDKKSEAKMELMVLGKELMPGGKPKFLDVVKFPMITQLIEIEGDKKVLVTLSMMVRDFCSSMNVVRNMNEDQIIEAAGMLLDECSNFRMEDYFMMFQMAKRGELFEIRDRIDLQVVTKIMDVYWEKRDKEGNDKRDEDTRMYDHMGNQTKNIELMNPVDAKIAKASDKLLVAYDGVREVLNQQQTVSLKPEVKKEVTGEELRNSPEFKQKMAELEKKYPKPPYSE